MSSLESSKLSSSASRTDSQDSSANGLRFLKVTRRKMIGFRITDKYSSIFSMT